jgi:parallel beta-helix repeat protein
MRNDIHRLAIAALLVLAGTFALPTAARAETWICTVIGALPYDITASGQYCLEQDLAVDGSAINITADQVVLDCNGHRLHSLSAGKYNGVTAGTNRQDVVVRNCVIEDFGGGIYLSGTGDPGAHGNLIEGNTVLRSGGYGIQVWGSNNRIERNRISGNTGANNGESDGIVLIGAGGHGCCNAVRDNTISDFRPPLPNSFNFDTIGISFDNVHSTEITGNTITGLYAPTGRTVHAIVSQGTSQAFVARNTVLRAPPLPAPLDGSQDFGIVIFGSDGTNVCRDNVVGHFDSADISGCVDSVNTGF